MLRLASALLAFAGARRTGEIFATTDQECEEPDTGKAYFDGLRQSYMVEECSKKDVCLLMRQQDSYFYERALKGELVDYDQPPQMSWIHSGRCEKNTRSVRMQPVMKHPACAAAVCAKIKGIKGKFRKLKVTNTPKLPTGCVIRNGRGYLNKATTAVDAGTAYDSSNSDKAWAQTKKTETLQFCQMDYSLSESAAFYYSPYKLKDSMKSRPEMSASCSFGVMAQLSRLQLTNSPCASILAFRPTELTSKYHSAAEALSAAEKLESTAPDKAEAIETEVEMARQKFVLIEQITTQWCPAVWKEAMAQGSTCSAPRFPRWAGNDFEPTGAEDSAERAAYLIRGLVPGETKEALMQSRAPKVSLGEGVCLNIEDEELDDVLEGKDSNPPDFFAKASV